MTPWLPLDIALALAAIVAWALYVTRDVPEPEGAPQRDVDIALRDQPRRPLTRRDVEQRRASSYLTRGF